MNRKRKARQIRKNIMKLGTIVREEVLNRDDDGTLYPKKEWGYCVEVIANGWLITSPDDSWYEAYKASLEACKFAFEQEPGHHTPENYKERREKVE